LPTSRLHRGEIDAIALAEEWRAVLLLMDDAMGVRFALERGLTVAGTRGVLVEAAQNGLVKIEQAVAKLKNTDFRATSGLYERAIQLALTKSFNRRAANWSESW
jgi:predicted nucleic acid-binding protein